MAQTPRRTPAKGKGRGQPAVKGCCCKRSQCIKNYCDCYQSMMICTQFCRCTGCRNTEARMAVEPRTPARNSSAAKRDRAAAMTAKVAAAAAKEGINIKMMPPGPSAVVPIAMVPIQQAAAAVNAPINIIQVAPASFNVVIPQAAAQKVIPEAKKPVELPPPAAPAPVKVLQAPPEVKPKEMEPLDPEFHKINNLFVPIINDALLKCILAQGTESEELGLSDIQTSCLVVMECQNQFKEVLQTVLDM